MNTGAPYAVRSLVLLLAAALFSTLSALAGSYPASGTAQAFTSPNGTTNLNDGTVIASNNGIASVQHNRLRLTLAGTGNTNSSF